MGVIVGIILFWIMWVTIEGELIDEGTLKPRDQRKRKRKNKKPEERNDLKHLFKD